MTTKRVVIFGIGSAMRTRVKSYGDHGFKTVVLDMDTGAEANIVSRRLCQDRPALVIVPQAPHATLTI